MEFGNSQGLERFVRLLRYPYENLTYLYLNRIYPCFSDYLVQTPSISRSEYLVISVKTVPIRFEYEVS